MSELVRIDLTELNHSELVLLANWCGLQASRAMPRNLLIDALNNFKPFEFRPMDYEREVLSKWLKRWWSVVRMQVPKKVCPHCYECRDAQVLDCYMRNAKNIKG